MSLSVELNGAGIAEVRAYFERPINNGKAFFSNLAAYFDRQTKLTFRNLGARGGHDAWEGYKVGTLHPERWRYGQRIGWNFSKWNYRYGTDGTRRRYSDSSEMLQSSGSFMRSFRPLWIDKTGMVFGSNYVSADGKTTAAKIGGGREVLFVTDEDRSFVQAYFSSFLNKELKT